MGDASAIPGLDFELLYLILAITFAVLFTGTLIALIVTAVKLGRASRRLRGDTVDGVRVIDGVRYTKDDAVLFGGETKVSHVKGDIVLTRGVTRTALKKSPLLPGKYTVLSADENVSEFNIRIGGFVRTLTHFSSIVLNEGDEITPVSHTVILR